MAQEFPYPKALFQPLVDALPLAFSEVLHQAQGRGGEAFFREKVDAIRRHLVGQALDRAVSANHLPYRSQLIQVGFGGVRRLLVCDEWGFFLIECYLRNGLSFPEPSQFRDDLRRQHNDPLRPTLFDFTEGRQPLTLPFHPLLFLAYSGHPPLVGRVTVGIPHPTDSTFLEPLLELTMTPEAVETVSEEVPNNLPLRKKPSDSQ